MARVVERMSVHARSPAPVVVQVHAQLELKTWSVAWAAASHNGVLPMALLKGAPLRLSATHTNTHMCAEALSDCCLQLLDPISLKMLSPIRLQQSCVVLEVLNGISRVQVGAHSA